jgi:hypothetical protein
MIQNDTELQAMQERINQFQSYLAQLRVSATPAEFPFVVSGYKSELEKMQAEVLEYLTRHASEPLPARVA